MLTKDDLRQIGEVMDGRLETFEKKMDVKFAASEGRVIEAVGEMIEQNLFPKFDEMDKKFDKMEAKIAALPTKDYIDEKLGKLKDIFVMKKQRPPLLFPQP